MALLEVQRLGKHFASAQRHGEAPWIIRDLSFELDEGEFVTLLGPSGAGKSTILNMIGQVEAPSEGRILLRGQTVFDSARPSLRPGLGRQIGYVTQDDNLLPWRTLLDNVLFALEIQGPIAPADRTRARDMMDMVGLSAWRDAPADAMPYGALKRLEIARALAAEPTLLLLDEPAAGLNPKETQEIDALIQRIAAGGVTVLLVEHDMKLVMGVSDHILVLDHGTVVEEGTHEQLLARGGQYARLHEEQLLEESREPRG